jgi:hypothetical protein
LSHVEGRVLEVGSGPVGIGLLTDRAFFGCDLAFEEEPLSEMRATIGSAAHLPFPDREFEAVIASDLLEHVPASLRPVVVDQLIRVSRRIVIVGVPCDQKSEWADRCLARWRSLWRKPSPEWLVEHQSLGLPDCESIEDLLRKQGRITWTVLPNENVWMHLALMIIDMSQAVKLFRVVWRLLPGAVNTIVDMVHWGVPYRRIYVITRTDEEAGSIRT